MTKPLELEKLRRRIDAIDDRIHDLIMERTRVVESVRDLKRGERVKIRPAREDEIIYRLLARHQGHFPKRELARIWREIIVATLGFEGPFSVAVYASDPEWGGWDLARDHYGSYTPMTTHRSFHQLIEAVGRQESTVGIVPWPRQDDRDPWWRHLINESPDAPRVIARLPFIPGGNARPQSAEALVICPVERGPTGRDQSFIGVETEGDISQPRLRQSLEKAGFGISSVFSWRDPHMAALSLHLAEVDGHVPADDGRLAGLGDSLGKAGKRVVSLGCYARPLETSEIEDDPA